MVDNHAARTSEQPLEVGGKRRWISKFVIAAIFIGIIAVLVVAT